MHHIPTLFAHPPGAPASSQPPSTRPSSQSPPLTTHISASLADTAPHPQHEAILGTRYLAAHDFDKAVALSQKILDARLDLLWLRQTHPHPHLTIPLANQKLVNQVAEIHALNHDLEAAQRHLHTVKEHIRSSASAQKLSTPCARSGIERRRMRRMSGCSCHCMFGTWSCLHSFRVGFCEVGC